ncbi:MAG TPA: hypothetical protein VM843_08225 [Flavisolibacter sp.]|nr:hypothetical protein [Flavisolibacter sp.]
MRSLALLLVCAISIAASAQKGGAEHYYYTHQQGSFTSVPMLWYGAAKGFHGEARYNYEEVQTLSLLAGNTFTGSVKRLHYELTPMGGVLFGLTKAATAELKIELEAGKFFFSAEPQYAVSFEDKADDFFYSWAEAGVTPFKFIFTGVALQHTKLSGTRNEWEPGAFAGVQFGNLSIPVYVFNLFREKRYLVVGITWQLQKD